MPSPGDTVVGAEVQAKVAELEAAKAKAVASEDYDEAKKLKQQIELLQVCVLALAAVAATGGAAARASRDWRGVRKLVFEYTMASFAIDEILATLRAQGFAVQVPPSMRRRYVDKHGKVFTGMMDKLVWATR